MSTQIIIPLILAEFVPTLLRCLRCLDYLLGIIGAILLNAVLVVDDPGPLVSHGHSHQTEEEDLSKQQFFGFYPWWLTGAAC